MYSTEASGMKGPENEFWQKGGEPNCWWGIVVTVCLGDDMRFSLP